MRTLTLRGTHIDRNEIASRLISKLIIINATKYYLEYIFMYAFLEISEVRFGNGYNNIKN